ncbi:uncharacterized protein LOC115883584 [Sitophilus oryzae]|uniref:Uncharacterized protein LOC115883584 n=1 Tax=Sitophilus oryzae TaxID=7048 RepID=A0A6J2Y3F8_SITOR|nr:uncharacterized protein LOC115883584 [Sitophilus oryzae]
MWWNGYTSGRTYFISLSFADDQVVIAQDSYDLEFMLNRLHEEYERWGLKISFKKTEFLVVNSETNFELLLNDEVQLSQIEQIKYLGVNINKRGLEQQEVKIRIQNAKRVIECLNSVWWDRQVSKRNWTNKLENDLDRAWLNPSCRLNPCYGCEVWTVNSGMHTDMDYLRRSARVSRRECVRNEVIRRRRDAQDTVVDRIERRSLNWFGHLMRMPDYRWPKRVFQWVPSQRRKRGRPRRSWNDGIRESMEARQLEDDDVFEID